MTSKQKQTFQDLKAGKLTAKQRADFYYRMSKILKEDLESLKDISNLLGELPDSYLEKIDLQEAATCAMGLTEKLVERVGPSPISVEDGKYWIHRYFRVNLADSLSGLTQALATVNVSYQPTEKESQSYTDLRYHKFILDDILRSNERPNGVFTPEELNEKVASIVKGRPYTASVSGLTGSPTEEAGKSIMAGKPLSECGITNVFDVGVKDVGLKDSKREEPK